MKDLASLAQILSGLSAMTLAALALWARQNYRRQVNLEQMKWLQQLYDSFYTSDRYRTIRQAVDFDELEQTLDLLRRGDSEPQQLTLPERAQLDQFTDYLNFFEWVAFLEKEGQLTFAQIDIMFKYYLTRLLEVDKNHGLRKYIQGKGYEQLDRLLDRYTASGKRAWAQTA